MAPVVRLLVWRTLVWSKARNAEGEKGKLRLLQAYAEPSSRAGTPKISVAHVGLHSHSEAVETFSF